MSLTDQLTAQAGDKKNVAQTRYVPVLSCGDAGMHGEISLAVRRGQDSDKNPTSEVERDSEGVPFLFVQTGGRYTYRVPALAAVIAATVIESADVEQVENAIKEQGLS